jgi:anti-sigma factor ChrR (cupin superfamily)
MGLRTRWIFVIPRKLFDMTQQTEVLQIHADFSQSVAVDSSTLPWQLSPQTGVERRMLDRIGGEVARATSIVRYAPQSRFSAHRHDAGEEFLVLDGVFSDEHGDYPAGTYVRNPPGSSHSPGTETGCTIFVKLRQMIAAEQTRLVMASESNRPREHLADGRERIVLHACSFGLETVAIERVPPGHDGPELPNPRGAEILVLSGTLGVNGQDWPPASWIRLAHGQPHRLHSTGSASYWVKRGHL